MKDKKRILLPIFVLSFTLLIIIYSDAASEKAYIVMKNVAGQIIPALFPYMVISSLIVSSGAAEILGRLLPISHLFKLPKCASAPIILGALCGFPLGASSSAELYQNGYISKYEAEVLISVANNTGPTFLIFVVGAVLWKNIYFGIFLYISQLLSAYVASLIINNLLFPIKQKEHILSPVVVIKPFVTAFSDAIRNAAISSLYICGFITFFSVIISIAENLLIFIPEKALLFICAILEFSEASSASALCNGIYGAFICGFAIGWSGLSVFCQTASFTSPLGLSLKRCAAVKLVQGLLLGFSCVVYSNFAMAEFKVECFTEIDTYKIIPFLSICFLLVCVYMIYLIKKRKYA